MLSDKPYILQNEIKIYNACLGKQRGKGVCVAAL